MVNKRLLIFFSLILNFIFFTRAQNKPEYIVKLENKAAKHYAMGDFLLAMHYYQKLYIADSSNLDYISMLGYSYVDAERKIDKAIRLLKKYIKKGGKPDNNYYYHLGKAYMYDFKIEKALEQFSKYKYTPLSKSKNKTEREENIRYAEVKRLIEMCHNANDLSSHPVRVIFENLGPNVNSSHDDYLPFIIDGGKHLLFTSNKYFDSFYEVYTQNIYQSERINGKWSFAKPMKKLNSEDNEELVSISADSKTMFVRNNFYEDFSTMLVAIRKGKSFKYPPENIIQTAIDPKKYYMGASYDPSHKTLYVSYGKKYNSDYDIYKIQLLPDGTWSLPEKLPNEINTIYDEAYPLISYTGDTLFFASKGHNSMGGYDIFYSVRNGNGWSKAVNLGFPINSTFDDYSIVYTNNKKYAYIAANRKQGYGGKDIYRISFQDKDEPLILIKGFVFLRENNKEVEFNTHPEDFNVVVKNKYGDIVAKYMLQKNKNKFISILPPGDYNFILSYKGFKEKKIRINVTENEKIIEKKIVLEKL